MHTLLFRLKLRLDWLLVHITDSRPWAFNEIRPSDVLVSANTPPSVFTHQENRKWFSPISNSLESELHFLLESIPFPLGLIWIPVLPFVRQAGPGALIATVMQEVGKFAGGCSRVIHHLLSKRRWPPGEPPPISSQPTYWSRQATSFSEMSWAQKVLSNWTSPMFIHS